MQKDNGMDLNKNIANIREEFPVLKYKTYMNSAAHGPALRRVWDAVQDFWTRAPSRMTPESFR
jgi:selenocysteine lyase/cysteine desulfurase